MTDRFVTAFHPEGFKQYGYRLTGSFGEHCDVPIHIYASDMYHSSYNIPDESNSIWYEQFEIPELAAFLDRHKNMPHVHGKCPDHRWKPKDVAAGYNYRFDMHKFARMIYVMWAEAHRDPTGRMVWLDGDCVLRKQLPDDFIDRALPNGEAYAYLGRGKKYSETGYLVFKLPEALPILDEWANFCTSDSFLEQPEQHSAFLFDRARERHPEIKGHDLTPNGGGHPIYECFVGEYFSHLKGRRKYNGRCPQAEALDRKLNMRKQK